MICWVCGGDLTWRTTHNIEEDSEDFSILTTLSCPNCGSYVEVYHAKDRPEEDAD